jgi:PAS domain-containing protein
VGRTELSQQMETLNQQLSMLLEHVQFDESPPMDLLSQAFEELNITLEELQVAQEELYQQNEELVEARQRVEVERLRYQELFESAPDGYIVTDIHGKILTANLKAEQLFNLPQSFLSGKLLVMLIDESDRRAFRNKLNQLLQPRQERQLEERQFAEEVFQIKPRHKPAFEAALTLTPI